MRRLPKVEHDDFMCRCSAKERTRSDRVRNAAYRMYSDGGRNKEKYPDTDLDFVDHMLFMLGMKGTVSIGADQWAGVGVKLPGDMTIGDKVYPRKAEDCWIQCDSIIDGIAAAYVLYASEGLFDR